MSWYQKTIGVSYNLLGDDGGGDDNDDGDGVIDDEDGGDDAYGTVPEHNGRQ